jgi:hypothetical protein
LISLEYLSIYQVKTIKQKILKSIVLRYYSTLSILNLFLGLVIDVVIFILLFICVVLIYSLLVTNVETRTFEIGILLILSLQINDLTI